MLESESVENSSEFKTIINKVNSETYKAFNAKYEELVGVKMSIYIAMDIPKQISYLMDDK